MNKELLIKQMEYELGKLERTKKKKDIEMEDRQAEIENLEYKVQLEIAQIDEQIAAQKQKISDFKAEQQEGSSE